MVAAGVFVIFFAVAGLLVMLVAMRSRTGSPSKAPSRSTRRWVVFGLPILIIILGIGVPAIVIANNHDNHAEIGPGGIELNTNTNVDEVKGREAFAQHCATCHTLHGANAVGKVGPNLDLLVGGLGSPGDKTATANKAKFVLGAIDQGRARGSGQMPARLVVGQEADDVAAFVAAVAGR
jgi:cytochrome c553